MGGELNAVQTIAIYALPVLFAITVHEAAHAYAAKRHGDATAYMMGRMTLNPLKHIDPIGTVLIPLLAVTLGGFLFGWAKPVPINFSNLNNPKKDMVWVAAAGPGANLAMAFIWAMLYNLAALNPTGYFALPLSLMAQAGIQINAVLMVLNLLPIPPLDGGRIAVGLLPRNLALPLARLEPYGMFILVGLMITGILGVIMRPFLAATFKLISLFL
ncbi:site-2 protease family protein [Chitinivorax sp. PXF-14]|uniref:site-2 protease family protein n=1 Tax=Chitinivorax sp. PXF-14 TaxID=3230488 RepID=UPI0034663102